MQLVLQQPKHIRRLLLHIVQYVDALMQVVDFGNLGDNLVNLYFYVVIHIVRVKNDIAAVPFFICKNTTSL